MIRPLVHILVYSLLYVSCRYSKLLFEKVPNSNKNIDSTTYSSPSYLDFKMVQFYFSKEVDSQSESKLKLHFNTTDKYGCSGYKIVTQHEVTENEIIIKVFGIEKPKGGCLTVLSPASTDIDLDYLNGNYKLQIYFRDTFDTYYISFFPNFIKVSGESGSFSSYSHREKQF